jgi:hypothetical protein
MNIRPLLNIIKIPENKSNSLEPHLILLNASALVVAFEMVRLEDGRRGPR